MTSAQWTVAADGPEKREVANRLAAALQDRYAKGGLVQRGEGKWYPGEQLPRWQIGLIWRADGEPLWSDSALFADPLDAAQAIQRGRRRRAAGQSNNRGLRTSRRTAAAGLRRSVGTTCCRPEPADRRAAGVRSGTARSSTRQHVGWRRGRRGSLGTAIASFMVWRRMGESGLEDPTRSARSRSGRYAGRITSAARLALLDRSRLRRRESYVRAGPSLTQAGADPRAVVVDPREAPARTALVVQARDGFVHVFLPPLERLEKFIELVRLIDRAATQTVRP
jgi:uncharacterized protein (DUF2126 family)